MILLLVMLLVLLFLCHRFSFKRFRFFNFNLRFLFNAVAGSDWQILHTLKWFSFHNFLEYSNFIAYNNDGIVNIWDGVIVVVIIPHFYFHVEETFVFRLLLPIFLLFFSRTQSTENELFDFSVSFSMKYISYECLLRGSCSFFSSGTCLHFHLFYLNNIYFNLQLCTLKSLDDLRQESERTRERKKERKYKRCFELRWLVI